MRDGGCVISDLTDGVKRRDGITFAQRWVLPVEQRQWISDIVYLINKSYSSSGSRMSRQASG